MTLDLATKFAALVERITPGPAFHIVFGEDVGCNPPDHYVSCTWPDFIEVAHMGNALTATQEEKAANAEFIALCFTHATEIAEALREREDVPVAYLHQHPEHPDEIDTTRLLPDDKYYGWTETPLYARGDHRKGTDHG